MNESLLVKVAADASGAVREFQRLGKEAAKLQKQAETSAAAFTDTLGKMAQGLATFNLAMGGVTTIVNGFKSALDLSVQAKQMEALGRSLPIGAIDKLTSATRGLVSQHDLMRLAARGLTGDFALTQEQMSRLMETAVALEQRGFGPTEQVARKLIEALGEKSVKTLDEFGIELKESGDRATDVRNAFAKFQEIVGNTAPMDEATQALKGTQTTLKDLGDTLTNVLGSMAAGLVEFTQDAAEAAASFWVEVTGGRMPGGGAVADWSARNEYMRVKNAAAATRRSAWEQSHNLVPGSLSTSVVDASDPSKMTPQQAAEVVTTLTMIGAPIPKALADKAKEARGGSKGSSSPYSVGAAEVVGSRPTYGAAFDDELKALAAGANFGGGSVDQGIRDYDAAQERKLREAKATKDALAEEARRQQEARESYLGSISPTGDFAQFAKNAPEMVNAMRQLGEAAHLVGGAFDAMTAGFRGAVGAMIDGTDSAIGAAKKMAAGVLKATAVEAAVQALMEVARAAMEAARYNFPGAAGHLAAAAKFGAVATAAGFASHALGGGGGGHPGGGGGVGAGGGFVRPAGTRDSGGGGVTVNVTIGDGFVGKPEELGRAIAQQVDHATRLGRVSDSKSATRFTG